MAGRRRGKVRDLEHELGDVLALERLHAREHLVEHEAQREDVGAVVDGLTRDLLRRHVLRRAEEHARLRLHARLVHVGDAEIHDLHAAVGQHHDVAGLDVAMDDAALVGEREPFRDGGGDSHRLRRGEAHRADEVAKIPSFEKLHRDERRVALAAHVVDRDDRRMADAARGTRFLHETRLVQVAVLRAARERDRLDGHGAAERRILRAIDDAHGAAAEDVDHLEAPEIAAGTRRIAHPPPPNLRLRLSQNPGCWGCCGGFAGAFGGMNVYAISERSPGLSSSVTP